MTKYIKPAEIKDDMGEEDNALDSRLKDIFVLLDYIPPNITSILDIGFGKGQISSYFAGKGIKTTAIGLELESYGIELSEFQSKGIEIVEANVENMPFNDAAFDAVIASHILEHVENTGKALQEIRRVIKDGGWLFLFLPDDTSYVCAGHINTGWNLGRIMYVLLLNRFNIKEGKFIKYGYSLCAYVRKDNDLVLPPLRGDRGDIHILYNAELWPVPVAGDSSGIHDGFWGDFSALNWDHAETLFKNRTMMGGVKEILKGAVISLFRMIQSILGRKNSRRIGHLFTEALSEINPKRL